MFNTMTEWEFTADAASTINVMLAKDPSLPFSSARCEKRSGDAKRNDLTLLDKDQRPVLTGEVKLPFQKDGGSPYNAAVVEDARSKALKTNVGYFFTWNVNEFVLWEVMPGKRSWKDHNYKSWQVTSVHLPEHMALPMTEKAISDGLAGFLQDFAHILGGSVQLGRKAPDEKFIDALEAALRIPILLNLRDLDAQYKKVHLRAQLDRWMRDDQGWTIRDDQEGIRDNLERASKFACYALVNKLVFYEALLKRYGKQLERLSVPEHVDTGDQLRSHLGHFFARAKDKTGDYETVFGESITDIGNRIPFYSDHAVSHWRQLINQIHEFDFSKLDYEIIGSIFERLIGPAERRKYGQFYTSVEIVDLINSFCIRTGREKIMDPACGGGTFLVRAYMRKKEMDQARGHRERLTDLFGVDSSRFATHLTTINLATRDLIDADNYPQILREDFFNVEPDSPVLSLPSHNSSAALGASQQRTVKIPPLDAVVGNPPYIRQETLTKSKNGNGCAKPGTKDFYQHVVKTKAGAQLSGRSDIHCYFWPHSSRFLKQNGHLCFITSSQWLDVEYGFNLQGWILQNFEIIAIMESISEPWFVGARVATTVTILRRQSDEKARMNNMVRFVQLRRPLQEIMAHDGSGIGAVAASDCLRDELLAIQANTVNSRFRARVVRQGDLWHQGVCLGVMMGKSNQPGSGKPDVQNGDYYGGKWGVYLRAPDLWFEMLDRYERKLVPLGDVAEVRFGVKSGKDCFFFPIDHSSECLQAHTNPHEFKAAYEVPRKDVESGRVKLVLCGAGRGEIHPIESEYLEPEVHSLMEIDGFTVSPKDCSRLILLVSQARSELKNTYVGKYIDWGEKQGYHAGATCVGRVTDTRTWYDLTGHQPGQMFWPMAQQYKHCVPANDEDLICNHNLFDISSGKLPTPVLAGILNSTFVVLSKFQYGRPVGVEGNLKTEVVDVKMMWVPDPRHGSRTALRRVAAAFERLKQRKVHYFLSERRLREMAYRQAGKYDELEELSDLSELDMPDRRELDDAVLQLLGERSKKRRDELLGQLYDHLREFFEQVRQKEEVAISNKKKAKRCGPENPADIAEQIVERLRQEAPELLLSYDDHFLDATKPLDTFELPSNGEPVQENGLFHKHQIVFKKGKREIAEVHTNSSVQDALVVLLARNGLRGFVRVPHEDEECQRVLDGYLNFVMRRNRRLRDLVEQRTVDEDMQDKIMDALIQLVMQHRSG